MHEYSIAQALLERAAAVARERGAVAVRRVSIRVGALAGVEPELLATAYEVAREPTICRTAPLEIERVEPRWQCTDCGEPLVDDRGPRTCIYCGAPGRLQAGDEIELTRLELEVADV